MLWSLHVVARLCCGGARCAYVGNADSNRQCQRPYNDSYKGALRAAEGASFIDTRLSDTKGSIRNLAEFVGKGKIVIFNFWSSANSASLKEQRILALYEQKNKNRVTVIGLSLDTNISEWLKSIQENGLSSVQLTDAKGWSSPLLSLYGVNSNPYSIVIDADGTILKRCSTASDALNFVNAVLNK